MISGCNINCIGCHSKETWDSDYGEILTDDILISLISKYRNKVTCVLFLGGEWQVDRLEQLIKICRDNSLKTALYTGLNSKQMDRKYPELLDMLDYIKTGKWISKLGGLWSNDTNQILLNIKTGEIMNHYFKKTI